MHVGPGQLGTDFKQQMSRGRSKRLPRLLVDPSSLLQQQAEWQSVDVTMHH